MNNFKAAVNRLDIRMMLAVGICALTAVFVPQLQMMTACIATLLCSQDAVADSWKAGLTRLVITVIGGIVAIAVVAVDNLFANRWLFIALAMLGTGFTLYGCKLAKVPHMSARIGAVTFILVILTRAGADRIGYAFVRLISTGYGVLVVTLVGWVFFMLEKHAPGLLRKRRSQAEQPRQM